MKNLDLIIREEAVTEAERTIGRTAERLQRAESNVKSCHEHFTAMSGDLIKAERALALARVDLARLEAARDE